MVFDMFAEWLFQKPQQNHIRYVKENDREAFEVIPVTNNQGEELEYAKNLSKKNLPQGQVVMLENGQKAIVQR